MAWDIGILLSTKLQSENCLDSFKPLAALEDNESVGFGF